MVRRKVDDVDHSGLGLGGGCRCVSTLCVMVAWKHLPFLVLPRKSPNSKVKRVQDYVYMLCEVNS